MPSTTWHWWKGRRRALPHDHGRWLDRIAREHDNVRAALAWSVERGETEIGLRFACALGGFWERRGHLREGHDWLERLLAGAESRGGAAREPSLPLRAKALYTASWLCLRLGDIPRARERCDACLALRRALGETEGLIWALNQAGLVLAEQGEHRSAAALLEEAVELARGVECATIAAMTMHNQGYVAYLRGDLARAAVAIARGLALARTMGDVAASASKQYVLGKIAVARGDGRRAVALHERSLRLRREMGDRQGMAASLCALGEVALRQGDHERATALLEESLALAREVGDMVDCAFGLYGLAAVAVARGVYDRAGSLLEDGLAVVRRLGVTWGIAFYLTALGDVARYRGDDERATELYGRSIGLHLGVGQKLAAAHCVGGLMAMAQARESPERVARLGGARATLQEAAHEPISPYERDALALLAPHDHAAHERLLVAARLALGSSAFEAAWADGYTADVLSRGALPHMPGLAGLSRPPASARPSLD